MTNAKDEPLKTEEVVSGSEEPTYNRVLNYRETA